MEPAHCATVCFSGPTGQHVLHRSDLNDQYYRLINLKPGQFQWRKRGETECQIISTRAKNVETGSHIMGYIGCSAHLPSEAFSLSSHTTSSPSLEHLPPHHLLLTWPRWAAAGRPTKARDQVEPRASCPQFPHIFARIRISSTSPHSTRWMITRWASSTTTTETTGEGASIMVVGPTTEVVGPKVEVDSTGSDHHSLTQAGCDFSSLNVFKTDC